MEPISGRIWKSKKKGRVVGSFSWSGREHKDVGDIQVPELWHHGYGRWSLILSGLGRRAHERPWFPLRLDPVPAGKFWVTGTVDRVTMDNRSTTDLLFRLRRRPEESGTRCMSPTTRETSRPQCSNSMENRYATVDGLRYTPSILVK